MPISLKVDVDVREGRRESNIRVESLKKDFTLEELENFVKGALISIAQQALKEEQAKGFTKNPIVTVDNRQNKRVEDVKPFGKIQYDEKVAANTFIMDVYRKVIELSPVDTGTYATHHVVLYNGNFIANTVAELQAWFDSGPQVKQGDKFIIVNSAPYSGKLERDGTVFGKSSNRVLGKSVDRNIRRRFRNAPDGMVRRPNGVYFLTARLFRRNFAANYFFEFGFMPGPKLNITESTPPNRVGPGLSYPSRRTFAKKKNQKYYGPYVYPYIKITARS